MHDPRFLFSYIEIKTNIRFCVLYISEVKEVENIPCLNICMGDAQHVVWHMMGHSYFYIYI